MTLSELVNSATVQGSVCVCEQSEKDVLEWKQWASYETSDLSDKDIRWAENMEVKAVYPMNDTLYIEVRPAPAQKKEERPIRFTYILLQLKSCEENRLRLFEDYETTVERCGGVELDRYVSVDIGRVEAVSEREACEKLFTRYNAPGERPKDYTGRSMSVSDVIRLYDDSERPTKQTVWFCDSFGFRKLEG